MKPLDIVLRESAATPEDVVLSPSVPMADDAEVDIELGEGAQAVVIAPIAAADPTILIYAGPLRAPVVTGQTLDVPLSPSSASPTDLLLATIASEPVTSTIEIVLVPIGQPFTVYQWYGLVAEDAHCAWVGIPAGVTYQAAFTAAAGAWDLVGAEADLKRGIYEADSAGAWDWIGSDAELLPAACLAAGAGLFGIVGGAGSLFHAGSLSVDPGLYGLLGSAVTLTHAGAYTLQAGVGAWAVTGNPVTFTLRRRPVTRWAGGGYAVPPLWQQPVILHHYVLESRIGRFRWRGQPATLRDRRVLQVAAGAWRLVALDWAQLQADDEELLWLEEAA